MNHSEPDVRSGMAARAILGLIVAGLGCMVALYGSIRLGIGRHAEAWWRPFENSLTQAHVENLVVFALGVVGIAYGAWVAVSAVRRGLRTR